MPRDDDLRHGAHADGVRPHTGKGADLGGCLITGPHKSHIDALLIGDAHFIGSLLGKASQRHAVRFGHVRETEAKPFIVEADQRIGTHHVDKIGDKHQCSRCKAAVDAAAGVGQHHLLHAQQLQNIKGVTDLFHGVALVKVKAALQRIDLLFAQLTHQQSALMPLYRGHGKIWNIPVGEFFCFRKISGQVAKAGTQHHGDLRTFGSA